MRRQAYKPPPAMRTGRTLHMSGRYVENPDPPPIAVGELVTMHIEGGCTTEWIVESVTDGEAQLRCVGKIEK